MPVQFNPSSHPSSVGTAATGPSGSASSRGISDSPSSIAPYGSEATTGFFSWLGEKLGEIWQSIRACFCTDEVTVREIPLEEKIVKVKAALDYQFNCLYQYSDSESRHAGFVIIVHYNNWFDAHTFKHPVRELMQEKMKDLLLHLLSRNETRNSEVGEMEIAMFLFRKYGGKTFNAYSINTSLKFVPENHAAYCTGNLFNVGAGEAWGQVSKVLSPSEDGQRFFDFVSDL